MTYHDKLIDLHVLGITKTISCAFINHEGIMRFTPKSLLKGLFHYEICPDIFTFIPNFQTFKVVIGDDLGRIKIYDASSLSFINSFQAHSGWIHRILESPFIQNKKNSNYIATCSQDGTVKIWDSSSSPTTPPSDWSLVQTYSNHNSEVFGLEWLDADTLASCGQTDEAIKIWSLSSAQTKKEITVTKPGVYSLKLLNNRKHLAVGGFNPVRDINIYDMNDGSLVASLQGHTASVFDLVQLSDDLLASSSNDATVRIWNLTTSANKFTLQGHTSDEGVIGLKQISSDLLASSSGDSAIKVWNVTTSELVRTLVGHTGSIYWALDLLNNNGQQLVSGSAWGDQAIKVWDMSTGECLKTIQTDSHIWSLVVIGPNKSKFFFPFVILPSTHQKTFNLSTSNCLYKKRPALCPDHKIKCACYYIYMCK